MPVVTWHRCVASKSAATGTFAATALCLQVACCLWLRRVEERSDERCAAAPVARQVAFRLWLRRADVRADERVGCSVGLRCRLTSCCGYRPLLLCSLCQNQPIE